MAFRQTQGSFKFTETPVDTRFKRKLHRKIGGAIVSHSKEAFRYKRWKGNRGTKNWKERKDNLPHPLLRKTDTMFDSIRRRSIDTSKEVKVGTDPGLPYPGVHNFGLRAGRGRGFKMPQRQFLGNSKDLRKRLNKLIGRELEKRLI